MNRIAIFIILLTLIGIIFDLYFYFGVKGVFNSSKYSNYFRYGYWLISFIYYLYATYAIIILLNGHEASRLERQILQSIYFVVFLPKILSSGFLIIDDVLRLFRWGVNLLFPSPELSKTSNGISRLKFLQITALGSLGFFISTLTYGIIKGAYNYTVRNQKLRIPNLPSEFEGLKIIQVSDLHVGSFMSLDPMKEAVNIINNIEADFMIFTGDLVNDRAEEALDFIDVFKNIKHTVYSVMGNHDYPEYVYPKDDYASRKHNFELMLKIQKQMGFNLLLNENRIIEKGGKKLALIGIENWGGSFSKYGDMQRAVIGAEDADVKLLLSHDPSHWDLQVIKEYKDIDVTFAGHTHGMQFGIEAFGIKFSPVQWKYKQWAGLYKVGEQQLYVNRGLGFVGYPGRVGISPEITVFELAKA